MSITKRILVRRTVALTAAMIMIAAVAVGFMAGCQFRNKTPVAGPVIDGKEAYHVIVAGGEPEGVSAALSAARNGMRTLLVEKGDALGGLMTLGMLNIIDMNVGHGNKLLTGGIFEEFYNALGNAFDIEEAKTWFLKKCLDEPNLTVLLNTEIVSPIMDGNMVIGLEIRENGSVASEEIRSLTLIDATVDGDVAAAAGAPYTWGGEDYGAHWVKQGVTLVFELSGVDWNTVRNHLRTDGNPDSGADAKRAWGYAQEALNYVSADGNMRFRGPNVARLKNGNVLLNALIIFGVDALDPVSYAEGIERGRREIPNVVEFVRENFIGFENAAFVGHAPRLYVRETRHFIGEYRLTITDVLENKDHWDRIGHGRYPVDIQPTGPDNVGTIVGAPEIYSIPFRCLVPLKIDQLLIAGRSASYDSLAHGSARVIPIGMVAGEACGAAAAYSVENGVTFRQMAYDTEAIIQLQNQLSSQGAYLTEYEPPAVAVMDHWAYPGLVVLRELALASGGYTNDYRLDEHIQRPVILRRRADDIMRILNERTADRGTLRIPAWKSSLDEDVATVGQVFIIAAKCASLGDLEWRSASQVQSADTPAPMSFSSAVVAGNYLISRGILSTGDLQHFPDLEAISTYGQLAYVMGALYTALMES